MESIKTTLKKCKWFCLKCRNEKKVEEAVDVIISCFTKEQGSILETTHKHGNQDDLKTLLLSDKKNKTLHRSINNVKVCAEEIIENGFKTSQTTSILEIFDKMFDLPDNGKGFNRFFSGISMICGCIGAAISIIALVI